MTRPARARRRRILLWGGLAVLVTGICGMGVLVLWMPGKSHRGSLPDLTEVQARLRESMRADLTRLSVEVGERNLGRYAALRAAADLVADGFDAAGLQVRRERYACRGLDVENAGSGLDDHLISLADEAVSELDVFHPPPSEVLVELDVLGIIGDGHIAGVDEKPRMGVRDDSLPLRADVLDAIIRKAREYVVEGGDAVDGLVGAMAESEDDSTW